MFYELSNITKIIFKRLEFSGNDMNGIFMDCSNLISLDLSHFNTLSVTNIFFLLLLLLNKLFFIKSLFLLFLFILLLLVLLLVLLFLSLLS